MSKLSTVFYSKFYITFISIFLSFFILSENQSEGFWGTGNKTPEKKLQYTVKAIDGVPWLSDGSFNPSPVNRIERGQHLSTAELKGWRNELAVQIKALEDNATSEVFFVHPFIDNTKVGIGQYFEFGSHLLFNCRLAGQTNANLYPLSDYIFYGWDEFPANSKHEDLLKKLKSKLEIISEISSSVDFVITGIYQDLPESKKVVLYIYLIPLKIEGEPVLLSKQEGVDDRNFPVLFEQQREGIDEAVQSMVGSYGINSLEPRLSDDQLKKYLNVACSYLDLADTTGLQESIDLSIILAKLRPDRAAPLQCASLGYAALIYFCTKQYWNQYFRTDYQYRSMALGQSALLQDNGKLLSSILPYYYKKFLGYDIPKEKYDSFTLANGFPPDLLGVVALSDEMYFTEIPLPIKNKMSDWLRLRYEANHSWFFGRSPDRFFFDKYLSNFATRDLVSVMYQKKLFLHYYDQKKMANDFNAIVDYTHQIAFNFALRDIVQKLCAMLKDDDLASSAEKLAKQIAVLVKYDADKILKFARNDQYIELMRELSPLVQNWQYFPSVPQVRWGGLESIQNPYYACVKITREPWSQIKNSRMLADSEGGINGLSFSPLERARLTDLQINMGLAMFLDFVDTKFGSRESAIPIAKNYWSVYPDDPMFYSEVYSLFRSGELPNKEKVFKLCLDGVSEHYPIGSMNHYWRGRYYYFLNDREKGFEFLTKFYRFNPFSNGVWLSLGKAFDRYFEYEKAIFCFQKFVKMVPGRWHEEFRIHEMNRILGRPDKSEVETYWKAVRSLPGNHDLKSKLGDLLIDVLKDYDETLKLSDMMDRSSHPSARINAKWMRFRVYFAQNNLKDAAGVLGEIERSDFSGLSYYNQMSEVGRGWVKLKNFKRAGEILKEVYSSWVGSSILLSIDYYYAQENYSQALKETIRMEKRYPGNQYSREKMVACLEKTNQPDQVLKVLNQYGIVDDRFWAWPKLAEIYLKNGEKGKVEKLVEDAFSHQSPYLTIDGVHELLDVYEKVDREKADELRKKVLDLFRGTPLPDSFR